MTDDRKQIVDLEALVEDAEQALGQVLVKHMPLATSGDVDPSTSHLVGYAIKLLATAWCEANASDHYIMRENVKR